MILFTVARLVDFAPDHFPSRLHLIVSSCPQQQRHTPAATEILKILIYDLTDFVAQFPTIQVSTTMAHCLVPILQCLRFLYPLYVPSTLFQELHHTTSSFLDFRGPQRKMDEFARMPVTDYCRQNEES